MAITREEVRHIARLARIALSDSEVDSFGDQIGKLLDYMKQLDRLDTNAVAPTIHLADTGTLLRDDIVCPFEDTEAILKSATDRAGDFFRVPRILE